MMPAEIAATLARVLGEPVARIEKVGAGGNSRVYRVDTASGSVAAKLYFQRTADGRDRLEAEFGGLRFLWDNGVRCIPQPLKADRESQVAIYQFLPGRELAADSVAKGHIDQVCDFLARLKELAAVPGAASLPLAAEASLAAAGIAQNIRARLALLQGAEGAEPAYGELRRFLGEQFEPALERWEGEARRSLGEGSYVAPIAAAARTLSPSDYGFHNALLGDDGALRFVDFEYFGWDDPAKMISDFLWHPRSTMVERHKERFADRIMATFCDIDGLGLRMQAAFPLFGLKWCIILLNEFRPENLARRRFASGSTDETEAILARQLAKAKTTLSRVDMGPRRFSQPTRK
jgi:hypothetical protein